MTETDISAEPVAAIRLTRQRAFMLVIVGQAVSQLGNTAFKVGLAFSSLALDRSGSLLPQIFVAQGVGMVAALAVGGVLTDRRSARTIVLASDLVRFAFVTAVTLLFATDRAEGWHLLALGLAFGVAEGVFQPAMGAATPELLAPELLPAGNAFRTALWRGVSLVGGPLGAVLVLASVEMAFVVNAVTFAVAAGALLLGGKWPYPHSARSRGRMVEELRAGISFVVRAPWLWGLIAVSCAMVVFVFAGSFSVLPLVLARNPDGEWQYGLLLTVTAVGGLIAGLLMMRSSTPRRAGLAFLALSLVVVVAYAGLTCWTHVVVLVVLGAVAGAATAAASILYSNVLQSMVPREMLGRVSSVDMLGSFAAIPIAQAVLAWCVSLWRPSSVFLASLAVAAVLMVAASILSPVRHLKLEPRGAA